MLDPNDIDVVFSSNVLEADLGPSALLWQGETAKRQGISLSSLLKKRPSSFQ